MEEFIWKNVSSLSKGVYIKNKLPIVPRAEKNVEKITIPGRNGCLFEDTESYSDIPYSIECNVKENVDFNDLKQWLLGNSELILSNSPNVFYKGYLFNQLDFETMAKHFNSFQLDFVLQPFAYSQEKFIKTLNGEQESDLIISDATEKMYPIIKVYGNEKISFILNKKTIEINPEEYITIDCEMLEAYIDNENANSKISGDIEKLFLTPGKNEIDIVGNYTKIEIEYRKLFL